MAKFGLVDSYYDVIDLRPAELLRNIGISVGILAVGVYNWSGLSDPSPVHDKTEEHRRA